MKSTTGRVEGNILDPKTKALPLRLLKFQLPCSIDSPSLSTMALLGDDGRGYDLARKLESCGVWRSWLGDTYYSSFVHSLSSPATWESFMRADHTKSKSQIHLQLRARALLFDKAVISLFLPNDNPSSASISKLNPNYLQLHGDDLYFTLENNSQDGVQMRDNVGSSNTAPSKSQLKSSYNAGTRYDESQYEMLPQRIRSDELPETWYDQFIEKYKLSRPYKVLLGQRELDRRTAEGMSDYLRVVEKHKRRRVPFLDNQSTGSGNSVSESSSSMQSDAVSDFNNLVDGDVFLPETLFLMNSVPQVAVPAINREKINLKVELNGILDTLPQVNTRSPVMIERLGIRPEYLGMEQGGNFHRGKNVSEGINKCLSDERASQVSQKVISRLLHGWGFDGVTEVPLEVFSQLLGRQIHKLGLTLKLLSDGYRRHCSAIELIRMFLEVAGYGTFEVFTELVKEGSRNIAPQTQQQVHAMQPQSQAQQQSPLKLPQQIPRQMNQQMQQMVQPQNLALQQQLQQQQYEMMRKRQQTSPHPSMDMDRDRAPVQAKVENSLELQMDANALTAVNPRQSQMQIRQQQLNAMSNLHSKSSNQLRQLASVQIPQVQTPQVQAPQVQMHQMQTPVQMSQIQTPQVQMSQMQAPQVQTSQMQTPTMQSQNMGIVRAPPVKVEGFQELMGGDTSSKHDSEERLHEFARCVAVKDL
ncbi:uncharacterized protein LOC123226443 isoform X2 [Mangifera indica]|uniref:uncharacterized protein LOC123226443 isoform X2 n=2 Tax=Mangifera indica TaxID=29780 RepID=UPI001CF9AB82|nr:uncharacterized protein LOC123226443 isoform X2 [Mangifera indica]